jgi:hypothetical protein
MTFNELYNLAKSQPDRMVTIHNSKPFSLHKFAELQKHTIDNHPINPKKSAVCKSAKNNLKIILLK